MSSNYEVRMLENALMATINASNVEIEVKRVIVSDILGKINEQADAIVKAEEEKIHERKLGESVSGEN